MNIVNRVINSTIVSVLGLIFLMDVGPKTNKILESIVTVTIKIITSGWWVTFWIVFSFLLGILIGYLTKI